MIVQKRHRRSEERGVALIIVLGVLVSLTLLGLTVLQTSGFDIQTAGAEKSADAALYLSEAGIAWAMRSLEEDFSVSLTSPDWDTELFTPLTADGRLIAVPDSHCGSSSDCLNWFQLSPGAVGDTVTFGDGVYRVFVKDDEYLESGADANGAILIRSLGISRDGARRMLEVAIASKGGP